MEGWKLKTTPANAEGTYTIEPITVVYVYEKSPATVTVKYVDELGNTLAPSETLTGKVDEKYITSAKDLSMEGWKLKTTPANAEGTYTIELITVVYIYEKNEVNIIPPTQENDKNTLPTTGESNIGFAFVIGGGIFGCSLLYLLFISSKKLKNSNH